VAVLTVPATTAQTVEDVAQYVEAGIAEREAIAADASCGWILDVRGNMGGNMFPMLAVVAPFLDTQTPLSWRTRDGVSSTVDVRDGRVEVTGDDDPYTVEFDPESIINEPPPTIVLQDDRTVSSGEAIVAAFLGQQGVLTVGQPTRGLSTSNSAFDLSDGSTVLLTTATFVTRDGVVLGSPIDPDVGTDAVGEKALAEAAALLRGSCA
jgi:C-terminal processing protease CtpA/Prc